MSHALNAERQAAQVLEDFLARLPDFTITHLDRVVGSSKPDDGADVIAQAPGGIQALAEACQPLLAEKSATNGYAKIAGKFRHFEDFGPTSVRRFVEGTDILDDRSPEEWQQDALGQIQGWLAASGLGGDAAA